MPKRATEGITIAEPTEVDLAYLAGLLDGEGCFTASARSRRFGIVVSMTDAGPIEWLHERFSGFVNMYVSRTVRFKLVHRWNLARQEDLRYLIPRVMPYLRVKGLQAWAMLRLLEELRAQPRWVVPTKAVAPVEREVRAKLRGRWSYDVAVARSAVAEAR